MVFSLKLLVELTFEQGDEDVDDNESDGEHDNDVVESSMGVFCRLCIIVIIMLLLGSIVCWLKSFMKQLDKWVFRLTDDLLLFLFGENSVDDVVDVDDDGGIVCNCKSLFVIAAWNAIFEFVCNSWFSKK